MKKVMKKEWYAVVYRDCSTEYGAEALGSLTDKQKAECLAAIEVVAKKNGIQVKILSRKEYEKIPLARRAVLRFNRANGEPAKSEATGYATLEVCGFMAKELRGEEPSISEVLRQAGNMIFDSTLRAQSVANDKTSESEKEKVHRLRQEGWQWNDIAKEVYFENNGIDLPEADVEKEVKRLQAAHRRAYPEYYKK